jgi:hypothetical protein
MGMVENYTAIWSILLPFTMFYGHLLVAIWYISPLFGIMCQENSGSPAPRSKKRRIE